MQLWSARCAAVAHMLCVAGAATVMISLLRVWPAAGCGVSRAAAAAVAAACMVTAPRRAACMWRSCVIRDSWLGQRYAARQGG